MVIMEEQLRDSYVDRQNRTRKEFKGNPNDPIRLSFYDFDGVKVDDVTRKEANLIAKDNPDQIFYFQDGNGYLRELLIEPVNELTIVDTLPSTPSGGNSAPGCPTDPQPLGPPRVQIFGGMGLGAMANAVISPISSSVIGFDVVNPGFNYDTTPTASLIDEGGVGSGGKLLVQMEPYQQISVGIGTTGIGAETGAGTIRRSNITGSSREPKKTKLRVKNIVVLSPGDGYLPAPDGSLGGNGRVWKFPNECYVKTADGRYYVVPDCNPTNLKPGDTFFPPTPPPEPVTYPVVTQIDEVYILDPGFGYEPGDTLEVVPGNGAILEPVINQRGEIAKINVVNPGIGFIDLPEIIINSPRGYNAKLIPVLKIIPIADIPNLAVIPPGTQLITVVDCVGKIPTPRSFFRTPR